MLNGTLQSVPKNIYDSFILREIAAQPKQFREPVVIGKVLGKYNLKIGDGWIALRIEKMIADGLLHVAEEAPEDEIKYRRILRKSKGQ